MLAVIGGGLYGGYRWTQTQYYVGSNNENVALYRGISQDLAWVSLSEVEKDHPEIELKYLPPYQRKQVEDTITESSLGKANQKITELAAQADACKKDADRRKAAADNAKKGQGQAGGTTGSATTTQSAKTTKTATSTPSPTPKPTPSTTLSPEEQQLVSLCGKQ